MGDLNNNKILIYLLLQSPLPVFLVPLFRFIFSSGAIFFLTKELPLIFLVVWVCWWLFPSVIICLKKSISHLHFSRVFSLGSSYFILVLWRCFSVVFWLALFPTRNLLSFLALCLRTWSRFFLSAFKISSLLLILNYWFWCIFGLLNFLDVWAYL